MGKKVKTTIEIEGRYQEVVVEVPEDEPPVWPPDAKLSVVGRPLSRVDGVEKITGQARYTQDVNLPGMLHARILRSPFPAARIMRIDSSKAEKLPGVKAVLTHENAPKIPWYGTQSFLLDPVCRHVGDEVACVAALDEETAEEALKLIEVEYEKLPFVLDAERALEEGAPKVYPGGNLQGGKPSVYARGDVEKGFAEADAVVEETFRTQVQVHACLEPHASVARWEGDKLVVWDSTQAVFGVREQLARTLNLPLSRVRVLAPFIGGGFGSKLWLNKYTVLAALLARQTGRPVKISLDREEDCVNTGNRPSSVQTIKAGCKKDGTLTALFLKSAGPVGAYDSGAGAGTPLREMYRCPNVKTEESNVYINAGQARPMRGPGHVQGTFALEQVMDMLAERIGMDPLAFRQKNYATNNQVRNQPYSSKGLDEAYRLGAERFGWPAARSRPGRSDDATSTKKRGVGLASQIWGGGGGPPAYAVVQLNRDGTARLLAGTQDIGCGTKTVMAQVAAEELGLPLEHVTITVADTDAVPYGPFSGGSITVPSVAPAVRYAAADVKRQLAALAAEQFEERLGKAPAERLDLRDGVIYDTASPDHSVPIKEVAAKIDQMIIGKGLRGPNPPGLSLNTFGVQFAEVEVDTETGEVRVLRVVAAHESGRIVNPLTASSQVEGGVIQGIGFALYEERVLNKATGRMVNANLHDYRLPTSCDIPEIETVFVPMSDPIANNVGAKGLGEPPIIPTAGAIANAVYDAIGIRITELPMTPGRVLAARRGEKGAAHA